MPARVIVLKLGGSVLAGPASLSAAVHEIHRWRRGGWAVVAVVSAFAGETDRLLRLARAQGASAPSLAAAATVGEPLAAALLAASLDRAGVPACVLSPAALALRAEGPPLAALPRTVDCAPLRAALTRDEVAVVPGYTGVDARARTVALGRGGSDLTALFLGQALGARCRLLKDVGGLCEWDPARPGPEPRRYRTAAWSDALATDGSIVQHRAVEFARAHGLEFEVAGIGGIAATRVGNGPARFYVHGDPISASGPLRVLLLGAGTVGGGVLELARGLDRELTVVGVCARDRERARALGVPGDRFHSDPLAAVAAVDADVVVECLGGLWPAAPAVAAALAAGRDVVTANKLLLAVHGDRLRRLARAHGARLLGSAAVGGCAPVLERIAARRRLGRPLRAVRGVLNGTANLVLERLAAGAGLDAAVDEAVALGLAERGARGLGGRDLDGHDAADKLRVIARALGAACPGVEREPFTAGTVDRAHRAAAAGRRLRQIASLEVASGTAAAAVRLVEVGADDPLFELPDAGNALVLAGDAGSELVAGCGAGRWPTAESVLGDLLALRRARSRRTRGGASRRQRSPVASRRPELMTWLGTT